MTLKEYRDKKYNDLDYDYQIHRIKRYHAEQRYKKTQRMRNISDILGILAFLTGFIAIVSVAMLDSESNIPVFVFGVSTFLFFILMLTKGYIDDYFGL